MIGIAVLDHNVAAGVVGVSSATPGEIVEEDIVLNDNVGNAIDIDVFITASLVVEDIALNQYAFCAVIDLQNVVVIAVVENIVPQCDPANPVGTAWFADQVLDLDHQCACTGSAVSNIKTFHGDPLTIKAGDHGAVVP